MTNIESLYISRKYISNLKKEMQSGLADQMTNIYFVISRKYISDLKNKNAK